MQFLEGGAGRPNGRDSRTVGASDQDPRAGRDSDQEPDDSDEVPGHGSLMSRYRGAPQPPAPEDRDTPPPWTGDRPPGTLPAPGTHRPAGASTDNPWRRSSWTPVPPVPPAPAAPTPPPAPTPPAATPPPATPSSAAPARERSAEAAAGTLAAERADTLTDKPAEERADQPAERPDKPAEERADQPGADRPAAETPADMPPPAPAAKPARPPTAAASTPTRSLLSADESAEFTRRWRELQADFVDDPQRAVRGAGDLSREILQALTDTIADPDRVDRWRAQDGTSGTEDLRVALRQYRTLVDRLLEL